MLDETLNDQAAKLIVRLKKMMKKGRRRRERDALDRLVPERWKWFPPSAIVQFDAESEPQIVSAGTALSGDDGGAVWRLETAATVHPFGVVAAGVSGHGTAGELTLTLAAPDANTPPDRLEFYLDAGSATGTLFRLLMRDGIEVTAGADGATPVPIALRCAGLAVPLAPPCPGLPEGHQLLREALLAPAKFRLFALEGLSALGSVRGFTLRIPLGESPVFSPKPIWFQLRCAVATQSRVKQIRVDVHDQQDSVPIPGTDRILEVSRYELYSVAGHWKRLRGCRLVRRGAESGEQTHLVLPRRLATGTSPAERKIMLTATISRDGPTPERLLSACNRTARVLSAASAVAPPRRVTSRWWIQHLQPANFHKVLRTHASSRSASPALTAEVKKLIRRLRLVAISRAYVEDDYNGVRRGRCYEIESDSPAGHLPTEILRTVLPHWLAGQTEIHEFTQVLFAIAGEATRTPPHWPRSES